MKKIILIAIILLDFWIPNMADAENTETAYPSRTIVTLNGKEVEFCSYSLYGSNYFMLREIAAALKDTEKCFNIKWDYNWILLSKNTKYEMTGTEFAQKNNISEQVGVFSVPQVSLNDVDISLVGYSINSSNYFKLRDIARLFDFNISYTDGHIAIDTSKSYVPEVPYEVPGEIISTAHEANLALFINEMPIVSYYSSCDTAYNTEQMTWLEAVPRLNGVYISVKDLDNYGFDKVCGGNNIWLTRNEDKQFGILDGEIINSKPMLSYDVYASEKTIYLDGKKIRNILIEDKPYIAASELLAYGNLTELVNPPGGLISEFDTRISIDFLKMELEKKYDLAEETEVVAINAENAADFGFAGKSFMFDPESKFIYRKLVGIGKLWVSYPNDKAEYIGGFNGYKYDGKGIYSVKYGWNASGPGVAPERHYTFDRGIFQDGLLYDGIAYTQGYAIVGGSKKNGIRTEGAMLNGYRREGTNLPLNILYEEKHKDFRFGYRILREGEVKDGKYCGYYREYAENGELIFEGDYSDYMQNLK